MQDIKEASYSPNVRPLQKLDYIYHPSLSLSCVDHWLLIIVVCPTSWKHEDNYSLQVIIFYMCESFLFCIRITQDVLRESCAAADFGLFKDLFLIHDFVIIIWFPFPFYILHIAHSVTRCYRTIDQAQVKCPSAIIPSEDTTEVPSLYMAYPVVPNTYQPNIIMAYNISLLNIQCRTAYNKQNSTNNYTIWRECP